MNKKNISPNSQKPVTRVHNGQLPDLLAELSEEAIADNNATASVGCFACVAVGVLGGGIGGGIDGNASCFCSYDGDDAE